MPENKNLFYYGSIYHRLFDPPLTDNRRAAAGLIPAGSSVLDIACGTGLFSILLREEKNCRVVGIDLSLQMLEFARKSDPHQEVTFLHKDATDLSDFTDHSFDYATILMMVHELPRAKQLKVLGEALRVANKVIIIDSACPLSKNLGGIGVRITEATFGHDHHQNFNDFLAGGGIGGLLKEFAPSICIEHRSVFSHNTREVVLLTKQQ